MISFAPVLRRRRPVLVFYLLLAVAMAPGLGRLQIDNSPEGFFVRDAEALADYRHFEVTFGRDRALRLVLRGEGIWTAEGLAWLRRLEEEAQGIDGVRAAAGLYRHHRWRFPAWPPPDPQAFRRQVLTDAVDRDAGWVGEGGDAVTVLVGLTAAEPPRLLADLRGLLATAPAALDTAVVGLPAIRRAFDEALLDWLLRDLPPLAVMTVALLALIFRQPAATAAPLLLVAVCQIVVFGAMGYAGQRFDLVIMILAPIQFVVALATAVHVLIRFRDLRSRGLDAGAATRETYRVKAWPVLWTGITTAAGFGSLAVSAAPPVRALGSWAAFAMTFTTLAALSFYPALLASIGGSRSPPRGRFEIWSRRFGRACASRAIAHRRLLFAAFGLTAVLALAGVPRLRLETSVLAYLDDRHQLRGEIVSLEERGLAVATAELVLEAEEPWFRDPDGLDRLRQLTAALRRQSRVTGAVSAGDLIASVARHLPAAAGPADSAALEQIDRQPDLRRLLSALVTRDGRGARIAVQVPMLGFHQLEPVFGRARGQARQYFPQATAKITGRYPLLLTSQRGLLRTLTASLGATVAAILVILRTVLASAAATWRAMVPNLWPLAAVLGAMGWTRIPVDSTTVMIAAVALGLAVDDTLHTFGAFRWLTASPRAPVATLELTAGAHLLTSLLLAAGFAVLALSDFVPVARFASLMAMAIVAALVADLLLVPALLATLPKAAIARLSPENARAEI